MNPYRYYQEDADKAIDAELIQVGVTKCIVIMFCGTGKSLVMLKCKIIKDKNLVVYVFPSLALIDQFYTVYLQNSHKTILKISSRAEDTTNPVDIVEFLSIPENKIICVTYQSYKTLLDNLGEVKIDVCIYDEAHHAVGEIYQQLIFENNVCEKQIFFTATPKNANGIVMYDRENLDANMCGKLVYDYSYLRGMNEGYLNPFEIRIDMYTENTTKSVYESIARAILSSGNNRVLTFHSDVTTDRDTSVNNFVNEIEFNRVFREIQETEFPTNEIYTEISMVGLSAEINGNDREQILESFESTPSNKVFVISSCETIGEGVDTKTANMCVFVDPKSSYVKIIQNIGRIVRKEFGQDKPNSTILIPCWVNKTKYIDCAGDKEKCDEVIRQDMNESGNFNGILNVLSALKQEDPELYDICLHYPDTYSPQEIKSNLEKHGYTIQEPIGDGLLIETLEHLLETEIDYEDFETEEEMIINIAENNDVCVEIHTNSLENPIERYNSECDSGQTIRLYKSIDEELEEDMYQPIIKKDGQKKHSDRIIGPNKKNRLKTTVHTNPDIKVLWNITSGFDITKDICSCIIDCEVIKYDPMTIASEIVERANERVKHGFYLIPRYCHKEKRNTPELIEENKDLRKLDTWKWALKGKGHRTKCSVELCNYLDENLPNWLLDSDTKELQKAKEIIERANERVSQGFHSIPRQHHKEKRNTPELIQEHIDSRKLDTWKQSIKGNGHCMCSNIITTYLDENLPNWSLDNVNDELQKAIKIVKRSTERVKTGLHLLPRQLIKKNRKTPELIQEDLDAAKLCRWKLALKGKAGRAKCRDNVCDYLDINLPGWRDEIKLDEKALKYAIDICERANDRVINGGKLIPRKCCKDRLKKENNEYSKNELQEHTDGEKIGGWRQALAGKKRKGNCSNEVKNYLDENLPGWIKIDDNSDILSIASITISSEPDETETPEKKDEELKPKMFIIKRKKKSMKLKQPSINQESREQKIERVKSEISVLHQRYKTLTSQNLNKEFQENPELWHKYHEISEENEKSFPEDEIPRNRIIQELNKIKTKRTKLVVDLGCGKAQISHYFKTDSRFKFINYDHIASNDTIISCDISNTPLEDDTVEICILSLAMWGSNCREYIMEANRILESGGKIYIIEATKRWSEQDEQHNIVPGKEGSKMKLLLEENGFKIVEQSIEKFCLFICIKV